MRFFNTIVLGLTTAIATVKSSKIYSCTEPNTIALTFDDGPGKYTLELLDALKGAGIHATFFINGKNWLGDITDNQDAHNIIKTAAADGHQIATHTWAHTVPPTNPERQADINKLNDLIEKVVGYRSTYFRAPEGECDENCIAFYESIGFKIIQWDTDTNDWDFRKYMKNPNNGTDADEAQARAKTVKHVKSFLTNEWNQHKSNHLVLMHDVQIHTVKEIIPWFLNNIPKGYKFVTVAECLGDATLGKANGEVVPVSSIPATNQTVPTPQGIVPSNNTLNSNLNKSGANAVATNLYIVVALLVYSLYMLL